MVGNIILNIITYLVSLVNWVLPSSFPLLDFNTFKTILNELEEILVLDFSILARFLSIELLLSVFLVIVVAESGFIAVKTYFVVAKFIRG